jgi:hypothetical protein
MTVASLSFEVEVVLWLCAVVIGFGIAAWFVLPQPLRYRSQLCAWRRDGSLSERRSRIEAKLRTVFVHDAMVLMVLSSLPVLLSGFLIHQYLVPVDLAVESLSRFHPNPDAHRSRVEPKAGDNLRARHADHLREGGHSEERIQTI